MNRKLLSLGFILIFLSFSTGFVIPLLKNPHLGVSAHLNSVIGGIILVILGIISDQLNLTETLRKIMTGSWIYSVYMNWMGTLLGGIWGTSRLTPVAGAGFTGSDLQENVMSVLLVSLVLAAFVGCAIVIWGLRGRDNSV
jgi:(hydroxyamino)benzene mutase